MSGSDLKNGLAFVQGIKQQPSPPIRHEADKCYMYNAYSYLLASVSPQTPKKKKKKKHSW